jgi:molecular chaperone HtpG
MSGGIVFQVETKRVLQILTSEIYDSPLALLRENVQNAYDAVRMRFAETGELQEGGRIDVRIATGVISITDNGIGMTEQVLRENFWKAGSSGKHTEGARKAGVVGTFGIGAMANFGVCDRLQIETKTNGSPYLLRSEAIRDFLQISQECISLERLPIEREIGTTVTAHLDSEHPITAEQAKRYLQPYVNMLPVPIYFNDELISGNPIDSLVPTAGRQFLPLDSGGWHDDLCAGNCDVRADSNGQVLIYVTDISLGGNPIEGSMVLLQNGGQLMGLRSNFGLAPIPAIGAYQLGGIANLSFLQPTAGREALSRESIDLVTRLVGVVEWAASTYLAKSPLADNNTAFLQWILFRQQFTLAKNVCIRVLPEDKEVPLGDIKSHIGTRTVHYYTGSDHHIMRTFANESACLLQVAQNNPRRSVQLQTLTTILKFPQVPDSVQITRRYGQTELSAPEASILLRIASILREDYLVPDVEIVLAEMSHKVTVLPQKVGDQLTILIARSSPFLPTLMGFYDKAYDLFTQFMKDFVRVQIYPHIQNFVPSSTRGGVDALRKVLEKNRELYRYEETEMGDFEAVLGEYLEGGVSFKEVLNRTYSRVRPHSQSVSQHQVGSVENEVPGVLDSPIIATVEEGVEFAPSPPIIRDSVTSNMKILVTSEKYPQLNGFTMLLGLSDRLMRTEGEFFRTPHTTRILWAGHRVVYIFTDVTGRLNLYYDIELREPIDRAKASGGMFSTTTLITKNRIFVPVPESLAEEFKIAGGSKEFFVRFDILSGPPDSDSGA